MRTTSRSILFAAVAASLLALPGGTAFAGNKAEVAPAPKDNVVIAADKAAKAPVAAMTPLEEKVYSAVVILAGMTEDGGLRMLCTMTAFDKRADDTHLFVSAAHCVADDDVEHERVAVAQTNWFVTFDEVGHIAFHEGTILGVGYQHRGDDFSVLQVKFKDLKRKIGVIPLAAKDAVNGERVINVAAPLALGRQIFRGSISLENLNRPVVQGSINWRGANLCQLPVGPGSSGSPVVSVGQEGIVAILVGNIMSRGSPNVVAIPVSKFKKFWAAVQAGKYRWYKADDEAGAPSGKSPTLKTLLRNKDARYNVQLPSDDD